MVNYWIAGFIVLATTGYIWHGVYSIACLSTKLRGKDVDVGSLESIVQIEECKQNEVCYVDKIIYEESPTNVRYKAGCRDVKECKLIGCSNTVTETITTRRTKRSDEINLCSECCYSDTCNVNGCNTTAIDPETALYHKRCFSCLHIQPGDATICNNMVWCEPSEVCAVESDYKIREYNVRCATTKECEAGLTVQNLTGKLPINCYDGHLKNFNPESNHTDTTIDDILPCPTGLVPTTPSTTTQSTTLTPLPTSTTTKQSTTPLITTRRKTTMKITTLPPSTPTSTLQTPKLPPVTTTKLSTSKSPPLVTSTLLTPRLPPLVTTTQPTTKLIIAPTPPTIRKTTAPSSPTSTLIPSSPVTATPKPPTIPISFVNVTVNQKPTTKVFVITTQPPTTTSAPPPPTSTMPTPKIPTSTTTSATTITTTPTTTSTSSPITTTPLMTTTTPLKTQTTQTTTTSTSPTTPTPSPTTTTHPSITTTPLTTPTTTITNPTTTSTTPTTPTTTSTTPTTTSTTTTQTTTRMTTTIRTTTPAPAPVGHTIPPNPTTCFVCLDDAPDMCDVLYVEEECKPPNNYCINEVKNFADGSKTINRTCGNFDRCFKDWYHGSSDKDVCQNFDESQYITLDFECVYCCVKDGCNDPMKPDADTLYEDK